MLHAILRVACVPASLTILQNVRQWMSEWAGKMIERKELGEQISEMIY